MGEIKNRRGKRSYFTRLLPFPPIAKPGLPSYHHHHQHHHQHHNHHHHHHHHYYYYYLFFFLLLFLLFFGIIQSQSANCKLPIRSEIYNCRFKNTNIVFHYYYCRYHRVRFLLQIWIFFPSITSFTPHLISISVSSHWVICWFVQCVHVTGQI